MRRVWSQRLYPHHKYRSTTPHRTFCTVARSKGCMYDKSGIESPWDLRTERFRTNGRSPISKRIRRGLTEWRLTGTTSLPPHLAETTFPPPPVLQPFIAAMTAECTDGIKSPRPHQLTPIETTLLESPTPLAIMTHVQMPTPLLTTIGAPYTKYINPARFVSLSPQELVVVLC